MGESVRQNLTTTLLSFQSHAEVSRTSFEATRQCKIEMNKNGLNFILHYNIVFLLNADNYIYYHKIMFALVSYLCSLLVRA